MEDMFEQYQGVVKDKDDAELARWTAGWKPGCDPRIAGELEMQRRRDQKQQEREHAIARRAWIAIALSIISLMISALALIFRK